MAFTVLVIAAAIVGGYVRGGRVHRVAEAGLRRGVLLFVGLGLQIIVDVGAPRVPVLDGPTGTALLIASQLLVLAWIVSNMHRPGMGLIFVGLGLNAVVIAANGGMPVDPDAIAAAGLVAPEVLHGKHVLLTESTRLAFLADILPLPPLRTVISVGDIALAAGLIPLVGHLMTYRPPAERRGGTRRRADAV